jgi:hypothetical protein
MLVQAIAPGSFGKLLDVAHLEAAAGRRYQLSGISPDDADRQLILIDQLQLPR